MKEKRVNNLPGVLVKKTFRERKKGEKPFKPYVPNPEAHRKFVKNMFSIFTAK